jgi:hypothetical protein
MSLKFKEVDYCNRRLISFPEQLLVVASIATVILLGPSYGGISYLLRAALIMARLYENFEFPLVQRIQIFYSALHGYIALITLMI